MLVIDNDKLKLAKMQERLLMATDANRDENLSNYVKTATEIDSLAFSSFLEILEHVSEHNHSLEEELEFLQNIKGNYDQLFELQLGFKNICNSCGGYNIKLSDLSQLNIEYIENRINVINGYLLNIRNIDINKNIIQKLNERLVEEEKKKDHLSLKLEQLEVVLKDSFLDAEGRILASGNLQYTSVIEEYKKLGIDFKVVVNDNDTIRKMIGNCEREKLEVGEKFSAAQICFNNFPNNDSKQILDEINVDFLMVKYRLTMLKIVELLSLTYTDYDKFKEKRENLLELIRYRLSCLESLGIRMSIDPFARTKTLVQLNDLRDVVDNSKVISQIRKELSQLTVRTEDMINQNDSYLISLANTKDLLVNKMTLNDAFVSSREADVEDIRSLVVADNQVVSVIDAKDKLNMTIIRQKTASVIKRVNQMINFKPLEVVQTKKEVVFDSPKLVIVPSSASKETVFEEITESPVFMTEMEEESIFNDEPVQSLGDDIFSTVEPFSEPVMFSDKSDDASLVNTVSSVSDSSVVLEDLDEVAIKDEEFDTMPDAFWVTENEAVVEDEVVEDVLSFDDQINLLINNSDNGVKTRKLELDKSVRKAA